MNIEFDLPEPNTVRIEPFQKSDGFYIVCYGNTLLERSFYRKDGSQKSTPGLGGVWTTRQLAQNFLEDRGIKYVHG